MDGRVVEVINFTSSLTTLTCVPSPVPILSEKVSRHLHDLLLLITALVASTFCFFAQFVILIYVFIPHKV